MKPMRYLMGMVAFAFIHGSLFAQHQDILEKPATWKGDEHAGVDTTSLLHAFKAGHFRGHFRYFFMATDNRSGLTDHFAHAAGAGLHFETRPWHRFRLTMSGFFVFNLLSSDLGKRDSLSGQISRYELGLFDIEDPDNRADIDRLEELFLSYKTRTWEARLGRQLINTPFINLQDGRMRPTLVEGIWVNAQPGKKLQLQAGWLSRVSPRSTTRWFSMAHSIGVYPAGLQPDGQPARYQGQLESAGVATGGFNWQVMPRLKIQAWDLWMDRVFNTALLQADATVAKKGSSAWKAAAQVIRQDAIGAGGHEDPAMAYFPPNNHALTWGLQTAWTRKSWDVSLNYNRITANGRYLMPREWGRDPFFTFMPRERNEGFADVHAAVVKLNHKKEGLPMKSSFAVGYFHLPDARNAALNKYGMPSYWQTNLDLRYAFQGWMQGLETQALIVYKGRAGETYGNPRFEFNKVNMWLFNLVINYHF